MQGYGTYRQRTTPNPEAAKGVGSMDAPSWEPNDPELEAAVRRYQRSLNTPTRRVQLYLKRPIDFVLASACLIVTLIPLTIVAAVIRLESDGPALLRQRRLGQHGRVFHMYKLRSMFSTSKAKFNVDGSTRLLANDERLTRSGRFIRRIGIDELPQLVNVIRGEMSLIGPRPDQDFQLRHYSGHDYKKLALRPGITSFAQVEGRNALPWRERIALEINYVEHYSLWLDIKIVMKTARIVITGAGSYNA